MADKPISIHGHRLRKLGFPEPVIAEVEAAHENGLFKKPLSADFIDRIRKASAPLMPPQKDKP